MTNEKNLLEELEDLAEAAYHSTLEKLQPTQPEELEPDDLIDDEFPL